MKKNLLLIAFVFSIFLLPQQVFAVDFSITNTEINAYLQEDGDVQVKEQHTYQFESDFDGITRTLIQKEQTEITDFQAFENNNSLDVEQEENLFKIYRSGSNEEIKIDLSYTITNGVELYTDLGQFYWPFFDTSNESTYQNMDIFIHPPQETEDVLTLGYDEAYETASIASDGIVHFAMGEVESGTNGDIRVAYDASLFPAADLKENKTIREDILADKTELKAKQEAYENRQDLLSRISPYIVSGLFIYLIVLVMIGWRKKNSRLREVVRSSMQSLYLPNQELSLPATILYIRNMSVSSELVSAALLDLVRKGYVKRDGESKFVVVSSNTDFQHENILIEWLFHKIGKKGVFSLADLEAYTKNKDNHSTYHNDFGKWMEAVKEEVKQNHLFEKKKGVRWTAGIVSLLIIPFIIMLGVHSLLMWMIFSIFLSFSLLLFAIFYQPLTIQGVRIRQQCKQLSSNYENISENDWNESMSDEHMQAYIYAIGTGNKSMQKKFEHLSNNLSPTSKADSSLQTNDLVMFILIASAINNQFDNTVSTVSATTSNSGSVPGGGTGVGGGGGGSGAF
ncbi:DUF2207 domain-containing protein [Gracilibacillus lacisalsi]|uniref:DUF2207 domain-containing protein n=1 Tax=Gracilibacillus lacisalsi TaxID=393087 RepID=UPI000369747A|nr:DUF2207 domain-containing protein [Gracilibacillus lacisalsi]